MAGSAHRQPGTRGCLCRIYAARVVGIDIDDASSMVRKKIVDGTRRATDIQDVTFGNRLLQEIIENRKHSARLAFTILRIVNVRAILREVVLVPSAHYGGPEPVRSLCSREA